MHGISRCIAVTKTRANKGGETCSQFHDGYSADEAGTFKNVCRTLLSRIIGSGIARAGSCPNHIY